MIAYCIYLLKLFCMLSVYCTFEPTSSSLPNTCAISWSVRVHMSYYWLIYGSLHYYYYCCFCNIIVWWRSDVLETQSICHRVPINFVGSKPRGAHIIRLAISTSVRADSVYTYLYLWRQWKQAHNITSGMLSLPNCTTFHLRSCWFSIHVYTYDTNSYRLIIIINSGMLNLPTVQPFTFEPALRRSAGANDDKVTRSPLAAPQFGQCSLM